MADATNRMVNANETMAKTARADFTYRFSPTIQIKDPILVKKDGMQGLEVEITNPHSVMTIKDLEVRLFAYSNDKSYTSLDGPHTESDGVRTNLSQIPLEIFPNSSKYVRTWNLSDEILENLQVLIVVAKFPDYLTLKNKYVQRAFRCERKGNNFDQLPPEQVRKHLQMLYENGSLTEGYDLDLSTVEI